MANENQTCCQGHVQVFGVQRWKLFFSSVKDIFTICYCGKAEPNQKQRIFWNMFSENTKKKNEMTNPNIKAFFLAMLVVCLAPGGQNWSTTLDQIESQQIL